MGAQAAPVEPDQSQFERLRTMIEITRSLTSALDLDETIRGILGAAIRVIPGADAGILFLYDPDARKLVVSHAIGLGPAAYEITLGPGEGLSGKAFLTGKGGLYLDRSAVAAAMTRARSENLELFEEATGGVTYPQSALSAALVYKGDAIGAFVVENLGTPRAFDAFDLDLVDALAQAAAAAIVNARLFESQRDARIKLEALNEEMRLQRDQLQRRIGLQDWLAEIVREGLPLSALASRVSRVTGTSVVIIDALNRLRGSEPPADGVTVRDLDWGAEGEVVSAVDRAHSSRQRQEMHIANERDVIVAPVVGGGEVLGCIVMRAEHRPLDSVDKTAADSAALVAAAEFLKERAIEENEIRNRSDLLDQLLEGGRVPAGASALSSLRPPIGLAVGALGGGPNGTPDVRVSRTFVAIAEEVVEWRRASALVTVHDDFVVIIWSLSGGVSIEDMEGQLRAISGKFERIAPGWRPRFGTGAGVDDLRDLRDAYNEVRIGIAVRDQLGRYTPVFHVSELGAFRFILRSAMEADVARLCREVLGPAMEHDRRRGTELLWTFRTYLRRGASTKATADELNVHPHTIQYRLDRLQSLLGLTLAHPDERLTLEMALRVVDAVGLVQKPKDHRPTLGDRP